MVAAKINTFALNHELNQHRAFISSATALADRTNGRLVVLSEISSDVNRIGKEEVYSRLIAIRLKELERGGIAVVNCESDELHMMHGLLREGAESMYLTAEAGDRDLIKYTCLQLLRYVDMGRSNHMLEVTNQQLTTHEEYEALTVAGGSHIEDIADMIGESRINRLNSIDTGLQIIRRQEMAIAAGYPIPLVTIAEFIGNAVGGLKAVMNGSDFGATSFLRFGDEFTLALVEFVKKAKLDMGIA